jgi:hypothetical protein
VRICDDVAADMVTATDDAVATASEGTTTATT